RVTGSAPWGPSIFVGMAFCWLVVLLLWGLFGALRGAMAVSAVLTLMIAVVNAAKIQHLGEPLLPGDLAYIVNIDFLVSMVGLRLILLALAALVGVGIVVLFMGAQLGRRFSRVRPGDARWTRAV